MSFCPSLCGTGSGDEKTPLGVGPAESVLLLKLAFHGRYILVKIIDKGSNECVCHWEESSHGGVSYHRDHCGKERIRQN